MASVLERRDLYLAVAVCGFLAFVIGAAVLLRYRAVGNNQDVEKGLSASSSRELQSDKLSQTGSIVSPGLRTDPGGSANPM